MNLLENEIIEHENKEKSVRATGKEKKPATTTKMFITFVVPSSCILNSIVYGPIHRLPVALIQCNAFCVYFCGFIAASMTIFKATLRIYKYINVLPEVQ